MDKFMTPKNASSFLGVHYQTLRRWENTNKIEVKKTKGGMRLYNVNKYLNDKNNNNKLKICYCRVSSTSQKNDLERQVEFMKTSFPNHTIVKEVGSGLNFQRKEFLKIIHQIINNEIEEIVVAHKDRLCRFGFELIENFIKKYSNGKIIILENHQLNPEEELTRDLVSIINVFSSKINGMRKYKKKNLKVAPK